MSCARFFFPAHDHTTFTQHGGASLAHGVAVDWFRIGAIGSAEFQAPGSRLAGESLALLGVFRAVVALDALFEDTISEARAVFVAILRTGERSTVAVIS